MSRIYWLFTAISCSLAFGQVDSNSVTVTASRNTSVAADQVIFAVIVSSTDLTISLPDVLNVVKQAGITQANFSDVNTFFTYDAMNQPQNVVQWSFSIIAPLANTKDTVAALTSLQSSVFAANKNLTVSFGIQGTQVSDQARQSQTCSAADLISDARNQAQVLASAGGRSLGSILGLTGFVATYSVISSVPRASIIQTTIPPPCSATVKFALLGS